MTTSFPWLLNERYEITGILGSGSTSSVYRGRDTSVPGTPELAIKIISKNLHPHLQARLAGEYEIASGLDHPGLVRIMDLGKVRSAHPDIFAGSLFMVSEILEGRFLDRGLDPSWSERKRISTLWQVLLDTASVLDLIHRKGLIHRDIKPANLSLCDGMVRVCDLGLAVPIGSGLPAGTPGFVAPEVLSGNQDPRSDLYSLGATIYWLVTGRPPRSSAQAGPTDMLAGLLTTELVPVERLAPWLPAGLAHLTNRLLEARPDDRPSSADVLLRRARRKTRLKPQWETRDDQNGKPPLLNPRLCGRARQFSLLHKALESVPDSGPSFVLLVGKAGSGRRRLASEALISLRMAQAGRVATARPKPTNPDLLIIEGTWADIISNTTCIANQRRLQGSAPREDGSNQKVHGEQPPENDTAEKPTWAIPTDPRSQAAFMARLLARDLPDHRIVLFVTDGDKTEVMQSLTTLASFPAPNLAHIHVLCKTSPEGSDRFPSGPNITVVTLPPLDHRHSKAVIESMLGHRVRDDLSRLLQRLSEGLPGRLTTICRAAWSSSSDGDVEAAILEGGLRHAEDILEAALNGFENDELTVLAVLSMLNASAGARAPQSLISDLLAPAAIEPALAALAAWRFVDWNEQGVGLLQPSIADMAWKRLGRSRKRRIQDRALSRLTQWIRSLAKQPAPDKQQPSAPTSPEFLEALASLAMARKEKALARQGFDLAAAAFAETGRSSDAARAAAKAHSQSEDKLTSARRAAKLAARAGLYDQALELLDDAKVLASPAARAGVKTTEAVDPSHPDSLLLLCDRGEYLRRSGKPKEAVEVFTAILEKASPQGPTARQIKARMARALIETGRIHEALERTEETMDIERDESSVAWLEARGLALYYSDRIPEATAAFVRAKELADALGDDSLTARQLGLEGMARQQAGDLSAAASCYAEAIRLAQRRGDTHGRAIYSANHGAVLLDQGRPQDAIAPLEDAATSLRFLGLDAALAGVVYNLGTALLRLGEIEAAIREVQAGLAHNPSPLAQAYLWMLQGEIMAALPSEHLPADWPATALDPALQALERLERLGSPHSITYAWANLVLVAQACDRQIPRFEQAVENLRSALDDKSVTTRATALHAICSLTGNQTVPPQMSLPDLSLDDLLEAAKQTTHLLEQSGARELAWRLALRAGTCARAVDADHDGFLETASRIFGDILQDTSSEYRSQRWMEPEASLLRSLSGTGPTAFDPSPARQQDTHDTADSQALRRLLQVTRRLAEERRLDSLLSFILDAVIDLTGAERGFLLLAERDGLKLGAQRHMDANAQDSKTRWSHSIAQRAMVEAAPVLTIDATDDSRFSDARSVSDLRLRSVLAVPLIARSQAVGTLYMDNRMRRGAFTQRDAELALSFADQAAAAIETARLFHLAEQRQREIERLNQELARELEKAQTRIQSLRTEMASTKKTLSAPDSYERLVGRSRPMQEVFDLVERIAATDLPVVIVGESGTGKELVAEAIHARSLRASGPFASENCGAVTETLLESLLFGHEKGAFTGATRRQRGLFEIAHKGTLFLDEVAEMSPAMQVKLLRVLQDGTFRRVGGDSPLSVDVRVIAASNQDIDDLVSRGSFRRDLFYRLAVVVVHLPPLRERSEDIPLLVEHFLSLYAPSPRAVPRVDPQAMTALMAYHWPGNVRQLENEVMRALALSSGTITLRDLSPAITSQDPDQAPDGLDLRTNVEALERRLIRKALDQVAGNRSRAAELLGLSRFGLLKKLRRYGMDET